MCKVVCYMDKVKMENQVDRIIDILKINAHTVNKISEKSGIPLNRVSELIDKLMLNGMIGKFIGGDKERYYYKKIS